MTDTILVTGSTGNVGSQVVKQLSLFSGNVRAAEIITYARPTASPNPSGILTPAASKLKVC
jgi:nucleoside-diphosphate-sugar epimerase